MKKILLTGKHGIGKHSLVDDEDYSKISSFKWFSDGRYAMRSKKYPGKRSSYFIYMHRFIMDQPTKKENGLEVDHVNGDGLDNRKENLRICEHYQNKANSKTQSNNSTGYRGVWYSTDQKRRKRWVAEIKLKGKKKHLGRYLTKEEAAVAYNIASEKYHGDYGRLNNV